MSSDPRDVSAYDDLFGRRGPPTPDRSTKVEGNACLVALRLTRIPPFQVRRLAGLDTRAHLTFSLLAAHAEFPYRPMTTGVEPDSALDLLTRLAKTKLWRAWVAAWDEHPERPVGCRALVATGPAWGTVVLHDGDLPDRTSCLDLGVGPTPVRLEPFRRWARRAWLSAGVPVVESDPQPSQYEESS